MSSNRYLNRYKKIFDILLWVTFGLLSFLVAAFCISYDLSEYIFGAFFVAILLLIYLIIIFAPIPNADLIEVKSEMVTFLYTERYGNVMRKENLENFFVSELKKGRFRYILNHINEGEVIFPRYVYCNGVRYELLLHENKVFVRKTVTS